jgi:hypothetical protein
MKYRVYDSSQLGGVIVAGLLLSEGRDVRIVKRDSFIASWEPVNIEGIILNNGYHVFEMPRSENLVRFLEDFTGMVPRVELKKVYMQIQGHLIDSTLPLSSWPQELEEKYLISALLDQDPDFFDVSNPFISFLKAVSVRFGENWKDSWHLLFPFFFPIDFLIQNSNLDEGGSFRAQVRTGLHSKVAVFGDGTMADLRDRIFNTLDKKHIWEEVIQDSSQIISRPKANFNPKAGDRNFRIALVETSTDFPNAKFGTWDEILVADERFLELNRVWFPCENNPKLISCEIYQRDETIELSKESINQLFQVLADITGNNQNEFFLVGQKVTRVINIKELLKLKLWERSYDVFGDSFLCEFRVKSLGTANMNKVWHAAREAIERAKSNS